MNKHLYLCHLLVLSSPTLMMHSYMNLKWGNMNNIAVSWANNEDARNQNYCFNIVATIRGTQILLNHPLYCTSHKHNFHKFLFSLWQYSDIFNNPVPIQSTQKELYSEKWIKCDTRSNFVSVIELNVIKMVCCFHFQDI